MVGASGSGSMVGASGTPSTTFVLPAVLHSCLARAELTEETVLTFDRFLFGFHVPKSNWSKHYGVSVSF